MTKLIIPKFILTALLLFSGCSKVDIANGPQGKSVVNFMAEEAQTETKATENLPLGANIRMFVYQRAAQGTVAPFTTKTIDCKRYLVTTTAGTLTPDPAQKMYLDKGWYDFYALGEYVSDNDSDFTVTSTGYSGQLYNQCDYIFATAKGQTVTVSSGTSTDTNVALTFNHVATKIVIKLTADASIINFDPGIISITGTKTSSSSVLNLATGVIAPSPIDPSNRISMMYVLSTEYNCIMLPVAASQPISFQITASVRLQGQTTFQDMTFTATATSPSALVGGKIYTYNAKLTSRGMSFTSATVTDWAAGTTTDMPTVEE